MGGSPVSVAVHGFTWTAGLVGLLNILIGGALVALIKNAPKLRELALGARRDDMEDLRSRVMMLEEKVETAHAAAHNAEMKQVTTLAAYRLIASELQQIRPDSPLLKQAQEMLSDAFQPKPLSNAEVRSLLDRIDAAGRGKA